MIHRLRYYAAWSDSEHRLLRMSLSSIPAEAGGAPEMREWKKANSDAHRLIEHFDAQADDPTVEDLDAFVAAGTTNPFEADLQAKLALSKDTTAIAAERLKAEQNINKLISYLENRRDVIGSTRDQLSSMSDDPTLLPEIADNGVEGAKNILGQLYENFKSASAAEKTLVLAGLTTMSVLLIALVKKSSRVQWVVGTGLGIGATYMLWRGVNKAFDKSFGRPLGSWEGGPDSPLLTQSQEEWDKTKRLAAAKEAYEELRDLHLPDDYLADVSDGDAMYGKAIANVSSMTTEEFLDLYAESKASGTIDPASSYPATPFGDDSLTPAERFRLVHDIGNTLKIIDDRGDVVALDDAQMKRSMLERSLDY